MYTKHITTKYNSKNNSSNLNVKASNEQLQKIYDLIIVNHIIAVYINNKIIIMNRAHKKNTTIIWLIE